MFVLLKGIRNVEVHRRKRSVIWGQVFPASADGRDGNDDDPVEYVGGKKPFGREWHTGWMGLALSCATAFMLTQGMKLLFGKPRPDFLSRCQPDLSRIGSSPGTNALNPTGEQFNNLWVMVTSDICTQSDDDILQDGFKSFPSGHASFSWAGLLYVTLFLASKFSVAIPFLPPRPFSTNPAHTSAVTRSNLRRNILPTNTKEASLPSPTYHSEEHVVPIRYQAAAPPVYTLVLILVPVGAAIYITASRFTDYRHFGFDLLFGSLIGITTSWFSFRWYHLPITRGAGWAWGPRSYQRSWGIGVGVGSYVGTEGWSHHAESETNPEAHGAVFNAQNGGPSHERHDMETPVNGVPHAM